jgi:hypothetical protein
MSLNRVAVAMLFALVGCSSDPSGGGMTGRIDVRLVDAPSDTVTSIVVTVTKVDAHVASAGWVTLANTTQTIDLLKLQGGTWASLGVTQFPAGHVTQVRLYVTDAGPNYVVTPDGVQHPLTVPSGDESGIKIIGGFDVAACETGNITLDFDGHNSIFTHPVGTGAGDEWILRPVIKLKSVEHAGTCDTPDAAPAPPPPPQSTPDAAPQPDTCTNMVCPDGYHCDNGVCVPTIG